MLTRFQNLAVAAAGALIGSAVVSAAPAQAFTLAFARQFDEGILFGSFTGTDANSNGVIEGAEFTAFSSTFLNQPPLTDVEPLPEFGTSTSWGLSDLLASSSNRYVSNSDFSFFLVNSSLKAWQSFSNPELDFGFSTIGTVVSNDPAAVINGFTFSDAIAFDRAEAVPEPMTVAGLAVAGAGMVAARRRQQRAAK